MKHLLIAGVAVMMAIGVAHAQDREPPDREHLREQAQKRQEKAARQMRVVNPQVNCRYPDSQVTLNNIFLFRDNGCRQRVSCSSSDRGSSRRTLVMDNYPWCHNDDARSLCLWEGVKKGTVIRVADDPECTRNDDWAEIVVTGNINRWTCVPSFLSSGTIDGVVRVTYNEVRGDGLDGKVSCMVIFPGY